MTSVVPICSPEASPLPSKGRAREPPDASLALGAWALLCLLDLLDFLTGSSKEDDVRLAPLVVAFAILLVAGGLYVAQRFQPSSGCGLAIATFITLVSGCISWLLCTLAVDRQGQVWAGPATLYTLLSLGYSEYGRVRRQQLGEPAPSSVNIQVQKVGPTITAIPASANKGATNGTTSQASSATDGKETKKSPTIPDTPTQLLSEASARAGSPSPRRWSKLSQGASESRVNYLDLPLQRSSRGRWKPLFLDPTMGGLYGNDGTVTARFKNGLISSASMRPGSLKPILTPAPVSPSSGPAVASSEVQNNKAFVLNGTEPWQAQKETPQSPVDAVSPQRISSFSGDKAKEKERADDAAYAVHISEASGLSDVSRTEKVDKKVDAPRLEAAYEEPAETTMVLPVSQRDEDEEESLESGFSDVSQEKKEEKKPELPFMAELKK
eukprot:TRINITY_DN40925_c0_g1_i1.p1 TRINITY_DN40925_c0_g1~~TRINITY_DN40925_c0_g1_i1.p1  ORF type:complete len:439 (-),score=102.92 TRINITY_DN40925_c0_g1_i1:258-1574(-)